MKNVSTRAALGSAWLVSVSAALFSVNAQAFTADDVAAGQAVYNRTCVHCHGRNMVNSGTTVYDLRRFPQDDKPRFLESVNNGKGNMPSWKGRLKDEEIEALWAYVATRGGKDL